MKYQEMMYNLNYVFDTRIDAYLQMLLDYPSNKLAEIIL